MKKKVLFSAAASLKLAAVTVSPSRADAASTPPPGPVRLLAKAGGSSDQGERRTVQRRRRSEPKPEGRERAEAPRRRRRAEPTKPAPKPRDIDGGARPPVSRPRPSGGGIPGGGRISPVMLIGLLIVLGICAIAFMMFAGPEQLEEVASSLPTADSAEFALPDSPTRPPDSGESAVSQLPTRTAVPFVPPSTTSEGQTWLVMLYQDADDKVLEQDIYVDLNEAERIGSSDRVHVVAQVDRYRAGYRGDGDWSTTKRFFITQDNDLNRVGSQEVQDLGEANMSDGATLVDFVTWAVENFEADKHVLIMSDHGMGWPGGWSDPEPGGRGDPNVPLAARLGDQLYLMEIDAALEEIRTRTGLEQFELIGMDACLMSHIEVYSALAPHARYAVASQETEPALGWAYTGFLEQLNRNPDMNGAELGRFIVESYIQEDQRLVDEQARAEFLRQGSPMGGLFGLFGPPSAQQLVQQMEQDITLSAIDLAAMPELLNSLNELSFSLQEADQRVVARARTHAQSFTSVFGNNVPPSYIDLGNFVQLLKREDAGGNVAQAADGVLAALGRAIIAEKHGSRKPGATGVSVYFPNSQLFASPITGPQSYTAVARRFADVSLWDDFLAFHYTGRTFEPAAGIIAVPERGTAIRAPGAGPIQVSAITLSNNVAAPGRPVQLSTDISGQNIGYVMLFVGFYDQESNSIFVADMDYLESDDTREIDGVYYPDWGDGEFTMDFEWEPLMFAINDGADSEIALFTPQSYGAAPEEAVYTVEGIYTYTDGGESRYARLYFSDGYLRQVFGFTGEGGTGAPREIIPETGDTFTILEKWMDLDQRGQVVQVTQQEGGTMTFGDQMFAWEELDAAIGEYIVGFIVQDLDGNGTESYERVTVE